MPCRIRRGIRSCSLSNTIEIQRSHDIRHTSKSHGRVTNTVLDTSGNRAISRRWVSVRKGVISFNQSVSEGSNARLGHSRNIVGSCNLASNRRLGRIKERRGRTGLPDRSKTCSRFSHIHRAGVISVRDRCCRIRCPTILSDGSRINRGRLIGPIASECRIQRCIDISQVGHRSRRRITEHIHRAAETVICHLVISYCSGRILKEKKKVVSCVGIVLSCDDWICNYERSRK